MQKKVVKKKVLKKKVVEKKTYTPKTKSQRLFQRYGLLLFLFFFLSSLYFIWMYGFPAYLNKTYTPKKVTAFTESHLGFRAFYDEAMYYTTPTLGVGVKFKDLKVMYPGASPKSDQGLFMKVRLATFEIQMIPFLMKTIRFNQCGFRTVMVNLYQDENNKYLYIENIKKHFNPQMPKYILEVPTIEISSYSLDNFNKNTGVYKKNRGNIMRITPAQAKAVLKNAPKSNTIMLR